SRTRRNKKTRFYQLLVRIKSGGAPPQSKTQARNVRIHGHVLERGDASPLFPEVAATESVRRLQIKHPTSNLQSKAYRARFTANWTPRHCGAFKKRPHDPFQRLGRPWCYGARRCDSRRGIERLVRRRAPWRH